MDALFPEMLDEGRVLAAAHAMTDTQGMKQAQGLPDALRAAGLACVGSARQVALSSVLIGSDVCGERVASFVACQIKGGDMRAIKMLDQSGRLQALFGGVVAQRAENQPGLDAGRRAGPCRRRLNSFNDLLRRKSFIGMQEWGETDFGIEQVVALQLLKNVGDNQLQLLPGLHQRNSVGSASQEIGEVGTPGGGNKVAPVCLLRNRWVDFAHYIVA